MFATPERPKILKSKIIIKNDSVQKTPSNFGSFRNVLSDPVNDINYNPYLKKHLQNEYEY